MIVEAIGERLELTVVTDPQKERDQRLSEWAYKISQSVYNTDPFANYFKADDYDHFVYRTSLAETPISETDQALLDLTTRFSNHPYNQEPIIAYCYANTVYEHAQAQVSGQFRPTPVEVITVTNT